MFDSACMCHSHRMSGSISHRVVWSQEWSCRFAHRPTFRLVCCPFCLPGTGCDSTADFVVVVRAMILSGFFALPYKSTALLHCGSVASSTTPAMRLQGTPWNSDGRAWHLAAAVLPTSPETASAACFCALGCDAQRCSSVVVCLCGGCTSHPRRLRQ